MTTEATTIAPMRKVRSKGITTQQRKLQSTRYSGYYSAKVVRFQLECGHYEVRPRSDRRLTKMRCYECLWIMEQEEGEAK